MKITNKTHYQTRDVRRIIIAAFRESSVEPSEYAGVHAEVVYGHRHRHSGWAYVGKLERDQDGVMRRRLARRMRLRLPKVGANVQQFAAVVLHEIAHLKGRHHRDFEPGLMWCNPSIAPWAAAMPLGVKTAPTRAKPAPSDKAAKCAARIKNLERKVKALNTRIGTWRRKLRYYERVAAAPPPVQAPVPMAAGESQAAVSDPPAMT